MGADEDWGFLVVWVLPPVCGAGWQVSRRGSPTEGRVSTWTPRLTGQLCPSSFPHSREQLSPAEIGFHPQVSFKVF